MQQSQVITLQGGLDLVSPAMTIPPGFAIAALNYEVEARGYRRVRGHERYDGRLAPSDATYLAMAYRLGSSAVVAGNVLTGLVSGATGTALLAGTLESGTYGGGTATGDLALHGVVGTFVASEQLQRGGITIATVDGAPVTDGALDAAHAAAIAAATALRRSLIAAPVGTGPIRGVATYRGVPMCWRDVSGQGALWKATTAGWVRQTFGHTLSFDAGSAAFAEGVTVTGGTSGATGVVRRVILRSGAWSGDAAGVLVLSGVTGTWADNEAVTGSGGAAVVNGVAAAVTLPAAGTYRAIERNFYATEGGERLYFTTGTGRAFEWDGTTLAPVYTGLSDALDKPQHIAEHRLHLFLGFDSGSLQWSSTGTPLVFNAITGAGEIGFGQGITGLKSDTRDSLIVAARNKIGYLVGTSILDFDLRSIAEDSGAIEDTLEVVGTPILLDGQGLRDLTSSQAYGDWSIGTLSRLVEPLLRAKREAGILPVGALRVRGKGQYRLYFTDSTALVFYFGRKDPEALPVSLGFVPTCFASGENTSGEEILLAGGADGMVYHLDAGTSFDGAVIPAYLRLAFTHQDTPNVVKRYHRARLEGQAGDMNSEIAVVADYGYADNEGGASAETAFTFYGSGGFWDSSLWNTFNWSAPVEGQAWADLDGMGENISVAFISESAVETPHSLSVLTINWSPRRVLR